jgi:hypothetical protein
MTGSDSKTSYPYSESAIQFMHLAALVIPFALNTINATYEPYWLDSPEFTAAVQTLGVPHPPGHPLYVLLAKIFTLLPFGTIGYRVSLASAFFGSIASFLLFKIIYTVLNASAVAVPSMVNSMVALAASLLASFTYGWWFQCVRQEVYSLQILLVLAALYPFIIYSLKPDSKNDRLLILSAFIFGLGLGNHHFIMFAALPSVIPLMVFLANQRGLAKLLGLIFKMAMVALTGFSPISFYQYVPIATLLYPLEMFTPFLIFSGLYLQKFIRNP